MTDFSLRGAFFLGEGSAETLFLQCSMLMEHLLRLELAEGLIRDPAVSLDEDTRTVEVELTVVADTLLQAHVLASDIVTSGFMTTHDAVECSMELSTA